MRNKPTFFAALAVVLLGSFFVWAVPGQPERVIPYRGMLQLNGTALSVPDLPMTFSLYDVATNGTALWTSARMVGTSDGVFSVTLGSAVALPDSVFEQDELYLEIDVDGTALTGRQRIYAAAQAVRSGHASTVLSNESVPVTALTVTPGATANILLDAGRVTLTNNVTVTNNLEVGGRADVDGFASVGDADITGNISATGVYERPSFVDGCPPGMERVGIWCIDEVVRAPLPLSAGAANAMQTCHGDGAIICPIAALSLCDELNIRSGVTNSCGGRTDRGNPSTYRIFTSDVGWRAVGNAVTVTNVLFGETHFDNMACYDPTSSEGANSFDVCNTNSSEEFFCCTMAAPTMRPAP